MHDYIFFDGKIMAASEAAISPVTNAALYGKGVFTTVAIYDGKPFLWEKHWRRICSDAEKTAIDLTRHSEINTCKAVDEIITKNDVTTGRARLTFFDGSASQIWPSNAKGETSLLIITGEPHIITKIFRLTISPYRLNSNSPLAGVKSCNYLDKTLALDEAKARGFDEAVQLNERGEVTSAIMANVFWLKDNKLYTPSLRTGCLAGTMRKFVVEKRMCSEIEQSIDTLREADAIFLTSAGLAIVQVTEFESRKIEPATHSILDLLPN